MAYLALKNNSFPKEIVTDGTEKSNAFLNDLVAKGKEQGLIDPTYDDELVTFLFNMILTELSQFMMQKRQEQPENEQRPFLDPAAPNNLFAQTMTIFEYGLRGPSGEHHE